MVIRSDKSPSVSPASRVRSKNTATAAAIFAAASNTNKLDNHHNCQMPEAGDVSVLAPLHHASSTLGNTWNARRHLKLNLNISQCHHSGGVSYNAANLSGRVVTSPCRPSKLGVNFEDIHMGSKKSKLEISPLPFSTHTSSLPGSPNHLHISQNNHQLNRASSGNSSPSGHRITSSDIVHYHQTFSPSKSSLYSFSSSSSNSNPLTSHKMKPATSPTSALVNIARLSPQSSPVVSNCGCGITCSAISYSLPSYALCSPKAKLKSMSSHDLALTVSKSKPVLIIDARIPQAYQKNHIQGAVNLCCTDQLQRRRILMGKTSVFDLLGMKDSSLQSSSPSSKRKAASSCNSMDIVVYDEHTTIHDLAEPSQDNALYTILTSLLRDGKDVHILDGGFKSFSINHESLCRGSSRNMEKHKPLLYSPTNGVQEPEIEAATASQVLPFLYLGNERDARDLSQMRSFNISYVLNVTSHVPQYYDEQGIRYKRIPASDSAQQNLKQYFEEAIEYIGRKRAFSILTAVLICMTKTLINNDARQNNAKVLIHCHAGVSRSATITIAYLLKHTKMAMADAYKFVKGKRAIISPNFNFMGQLLEFEQDLNEGVSPRILHPRLQGIESSV